MENGTEVIIINQNDTIRFTIYNGQDAQPADYLVSPIVATRSIMQGETADQIHFAGYVMSAGNDDTLRIGFEWGADSSNLNNEWHTTYNTNAIPSQIFEYSISNYPASTICYMRAYAENGAGRNNGELLVLITPENVIVPQPCPGTPTVTDYDGNTYNTIQIGNQCWMREDLRTTHYADGAQIIHLTSYQTMNEMEGYPYYYANQTYAFSNNLPSNYAPNNNYEQQSAPGLFYFGDAVVNGSHNHGSQSLQGVCPQGWHVPTMAEWETLFAYVGDDYYSKLSADGSNTVGFNGSKAGVWENNGAPNVVYANYLYYAASEVSVYEGDLYQATTLRGGCNYKIGATQVRCIKGEGITTLPQPKTVAVHEVESTSAGMWGETCTDGGEPLSAYGVCWSSTNQLPTTADSSASRTTGFVGRYRIQVNTLEPNTTYYFRAYATNANGTAYADSVMSFTTPTMMARPCPETPTVTDNDGNVYNTVQIGNQCWMKENLRTTHYANGNIINQHYTAIDYPRYYELRIPADGYLYPFSTVMNGLAPTREPLQGICPEGWHVPARSEYDTLFNTLGGIEAALPLLKANSRWNTPGTDASGFSLLPAGDYSHGSFNPTGCILQTSTMAHKYYVTDDNIMAIGEGGRDEFGAVRCVKGAGLPIAPTSRIVFVDSVKHNSADVDGELLYDGGATVTRWGVALSSQEPLPTDEYIYTNDTTLGGFLFHLENLTPNTHYYVRIFATNAAGTFYSDRMEFTTTEEPAEPEIPVAGPCPEAQYVTDMDGNIYNTVKIGNQCWMKENLRTTLFADGVAIDPENGNNPARYSEPTGRNGYTVNRYGRFYNFDAATKMAPRGNHVEAMQGVCPQGWHLPSRSEWETLFATAANLGDAAAALTENSAFWTDGREHTNTTGFSARPGSYCLASYDSTGNGAYGNAFYFATADFDSESMVAEMSYAATCINGQLDFTSMAINNYMPVRCIKGEGETTFAPTLDIEYRGITTSEVTLMGNYSDNNHSIEDFELYMSTDPFQMLQVTWGSPYLMSGQWNYFALQNLTPNTTYYVQMCMVYDGGQRLCVGGVFTTQSTEYEPCYDAPTVTDVDGNTYNTIQIGNYCWMKENLRVTHYPDYTPIDFSENTTSDASAYYYNPDEPSMWQTYGYLYNWQAATRGQASNQYDSYMVTVQGICPDGWHVPDQSEWESLIGDVGNNYNFEYYCNGNTQNVAKALASTTGWQQYTGSNNNQACFPGTDQSTNNATGFNAYPAGGLGYPGSQTRFWTSRNNTNSSDHAYHYTITMDNAKVSRVSNYYNAKASVRCVKD